MSSATDGGSTDVDPRDGNLNGQHARIINKIIVGFTPAAAAAEACCENVPSSFFRPPSRRPNAFLATVYPTYAKPANIAEQTATLLTVWSLVVVGFNAIVGRETQPNDVHVHARRYFIPPQPTKNGSADYRRRSAALSRYTGRA